MAIFTPSPLVSAISGNIQSVNFMQTRNGPVMRKARRGTNKNTPDQRAVRTRFRTLIDAWRNLSEAEHIAWNQASALHHYLNRLGVPRQLSGYQFFLQRHMQEFNLAIGVVDIPDTLANTAGPTDLALTANTSNQVRLDYTMDFATDDVTYYAYGSRPVSSSPRSHFGNWKYLTSGINQAGPVSLVLDTPWVDKLGELIKGEYIAVRVRATRDEKLTGAYYIATATVT